MLYPQCLNVIFSIVKDSFHIFESLKVQAQGFAHMPKESSAAVLYPTPPVTKPLTNGVVLHLVSQCLEVVESLL